MSDSSLNVTVKRVLYPPQAQESQFYVLLTDMGKCSGRMKWRPEDGERLTLQGEWGSFRGEKNFNFKEATPNIPIDPRAQLKYVCERAKGLGPAIEAGLWALHGENWKRAQPGDVRGFTEAKHRAFVESVATVGMEAEKSKAVAWLMSKGATVNMAVAAFEMWKGETIGVVQSNCFRLSELPHYSFVDVDGAIREAFGIGLEDDRRLKAAILYKLRMLTSGGSTVIEWGELRASVLELVGAGLSKKVAGLVGEMFGDGSLKGFAQSQSIALGTDYENEKLVYEYARGVK